MSDPELSSLLREVDDVRLVRDWVRDQLYSVPEGAWRGRATMAVAAAAAQEAYRLADQLPNWWNETSAEWRDHLDRVWLHLAGESQYHVLSAALAYYLLSPLNHDGEQDGPDDFDRPWTIACYSAVAAVLMWGVDFAATAVDQVFECIDLKYGDEFHDERQAEVTDRINRVREIVATVVRVEGPGRPGLTANMLAALRG